MKLTQVASVMIAMLAGTSAAAEYTAIKTNDAIFFGEAVCLGDYIDNSAR